MPIYNGARFVEEALDSLLAQTFDDFELILSDNGSTDSTEEICSAYSSRHQRIRYYRNLENLGAAWNYNHVFKLGRAPYFKWAAHDDVCAPTYLERCLDGFHLDPDVVLCYPRTVIIDDSGRKLSSYDDQSHITSPNACDRLKHFLFHRTSGKYNAIFGLIKSSSLKKTPLFSNKGSDATLLFNLLLLGKFFEITDELFYRRTHAGTCMRVNKTPDDLAAWYDPSNRGKIVLFRWRTLCLHITAILHTDLSTLHRTQCLLQMGRWLWRSKWRLGEDLRLACKHLMNRSTSRTIQHVS